MAVRHDKCRAPSLFLPVRSSLFLPLATSQGPQAPFAVSNPVPYHDPVTGGRGWNQTGRQALTVRCCGQLGGFSCA